MPSDRAKYKSKPAMSEREIEALCVPCKAAVNYGHLNF